MNILYWKKRMELIKLDKFSMYGLGLGGGVSSMLKNMVLERGNVTMRKCLHWRGTLPIINPTGLALCSLPLHWLIIHKRITIISVHQETNWQLLNVLRHKNVTGMASYPSSFRIIIGRLQIQTKITHIRITIILLLNSKVQS